MDAFFASVECVRNPNLRGKPVVVGGHPDHRGVVSTCSYEARKFGIHSAMSLSEAKRRCPHAIFLAGDHALYKEYSLQVMDIFRSATPLVEPVSIDEAYLDVTSALAGFVNPKSLAEYLHRKIYDSTGLTCSVGIASNKLVAKIASSHFKPNAIFEVPGGHEAAFLASLPIGRIPGIGRRTEELLNAQGINSIKDLQAIPMDEMIRCYGVRGYSYHLAAFGRDNRPVENADYIPLSIGAETTFESDICEPNLLMAAIHELTEKTCRRLVGRKMRAGAVTLKLRDTSFKTITRAQQLFAHTQNVETIYREIMDLFGAAYEEGLPLRLVGVSLHKLTDSYWQPTLWDWES
jgi:nucleotidyltransferase/DNA polymerase involved in DNA repair